MTNISSQSASCNSDPPSLLTAALNYALRDWPVFPVHGIRNGRCTCGAADCEHAGKHPRSAHGFKDATTDADQIQQWWEKWPDSNVGIATVGLVVIDVDPRHSGNDSLTDLQEEHGRLPATVEAKTGGGGRHIYFRDPSGAIRNSAGTLGRGLDVRAGGGYIIGSPSMHLSGRRYEWEASSNPAEVAMAACPAWLLDLLTKPKAGLPGAASAEGVIPDGQRNAILTSLAGSMRRRGMSRDSILAAMKIENAERCKPPLDDSELEAIAGSIASYSPTPDAAMRTDLGNSQRFARYGTGKAIYCGQWGKWLIWNSRRWQVDEALGILTLAKRTALAIFDEAKATDDTDRQRKISEWAVRSQSRDRLAAMVDLARPDLAVSVEALDAAGFMLNVTNGTLDLRTGTLQPHNPDDLLTRLAPVAFDPAATCPLFLAFLNRIMAGNAALIDYLQRLLGMVLTSDISEQALFMFHGGGANGKSVLLDTFAGMMGDYAAEAPPDLLLVRSNPEHPTEIADLAGRRLVVASETDEGRRLRVQLVKRLTGNARLKGRFMRGDFFEFPRTHKLILATNNRPIVKENTLAIWRRIKLVPFDVTIPPDEQDRQLTKKLVAEWPGILAWAVQGCLAWQRDGLTSPAEVEAATASYQAEQDPLAEFFDACCIFEAKAQVPRADLFNAYSAWAGRTNEHHPLDRVSFYERILRRAGIEEFQRRIDGKPTRGFLGLGLVQIELYDHGV